MNTILKGYKDMNEAISKITDFFTGGKGAMVIIVLGLALIGFLLTKQGVKGNNNKVNNSSKVTVSRDIVTDNGVKIGDVKGVSGDLIIKK